MNHMTQFVSLIFACTVFIFPVFSQAPPADFLLDLNQDGVIDSKDLLILIQRWGTEGIETPTPTPLDAIDVFLPVIKMVRIQAGTFMMGSPDTERNRDSDEGPIHRVDINYEFFMSETEITQQQWEAVMGYNAATHSPDGTPKVTSANVGPDYPVYNVSWDDCQAFITALNALGQGTFRLPSEAEWEYACRAGSSTRFYFGDSLGCVDNCENCEVAKGVIVINRRSDYMWFCGNDGGGVRPVRQRFANFFGLYDMAGNVYEWCQDSYHPDYTGAPDDGSSWESPDASLRVIRGGGWLTGARDCRSAYRDRFTPAFFEEYLGFRIVKGP